MKRHLFHSLRLLSMLTSGAWLLVCLWSWWVVGSYTQCGIGVRLCGFVIWGILLGLVPLILALPPQKSTGGTIWGEAMPAPLIVVLLGWNTQLLCLLTDPPGACADGGILVLGGLLWNFYAWGGAILLAALIHLLQKAGQRLTSR